jgi:hypothetical protein
MAYAGADCSPGNGCHDAEAGEWKNGLNSNGDGCIDCHLSSPKLLGAAVYPSSGLHASTEGSMISQNRHDEQFKARARLISHTLINGAHVKPELFQLLSLYLVNQSIEHLAAKGAKVILLSHLGRPKGKPDPRYSLAPVAKVLDGLSTWPVSFLETAVGDDVVARTKALGDGEILLLENTRFHPGEEKNDEELSRQFAALGDLFVNDAFGSAHRAHASTVGVTKFLRPCVAGFLMEKELESSAAPSPIRDARSSPSLAGPRCRERST